MYFEIQLPFPPSINHYYATYKGRRILSKAGRDYKKIAIQKIQEKMRTLQGQEDFDFGLFYNARFRIQIYFYMPDKRKRDYDNYLKPIGDAFTSAQLYKDDSQIDVAHISKIYDEDLLKKKIYVCLTVIS